MCEEVAELEQRLRRAEQLLQLAYEQSEYYKKSEQEHFRELVSLKNLNESLQSENSRLSGELQSRHEAAKHSLRTEQAQTAQLRRDKDQLKATLREQKQQLEQSMQQTRRLKAQLNGPAQLGKAGILSESPQENRSPNGDYHRSLNLKVQRLFQKIDSTTEC